LTTKDTTFAAGGGDFTRESLRGELSEFRFDGDRRYTHIRNAIEEAAQFALVAMADTMAAVFYPSDIPDFDGGSLRAAP
jgi:hypothetical protein